MRSLRTTLLVAALAAVVCLSLPAVADDAAPQAMRCDNLPAPAADDVVMVFGNEGADLHGAQEVQISIPRCDCTLPGTSIPPGQLGVACASPIGGPLRKCRSVTCYTLISTPWINGVCG
jgi:hypothetical protein